MVRQDVGQLLWVGFEGTSVPAALRSRLDAGEVGATILFKRNLVYHPASAGSCDEICDLDALDALNRDLHRAAPDGTPALIAIDQEGGLVQRVRAPATRWPAMQAIDAVAPPDDEPLAEQVGRAMGSELRALGFDVDFAPVLDVHTNPANPIIGNRAFGVEPEPVARRALAFARGLDTAGIVACGKHFPGHGDSSTDSHLELPRIDHPWERLERVELLPFRRAAAAGMPMMMTAHVVFAALDDKLPATLSERVVTGLLRDKLGYRGVIASDDLDMKAISSHIGADVAAVAAIRAGCDVLLLCRDENHQMLAEQALVRECERDAAFRAKVGAAAQRVRELKRNHAENLSRTPAPSRDVVGCAAHEQLAERLAGRS
ncbi:MAG: beta-N-acetylhexosaminidase [Kofleriaceae bacterium]